MVADLESIPFRLELSVHNALASIIVSKFVQSKNSSTQYQNQLQVYREYDGVMCSIQSI